jgi:hypothetical protein
MLVESMRPVDVGIQRQGIRGIDKLKQVHRIGPRTQQVECSIELIPAPQRLVGARLQRVLVGAVQHRDLEIVERIAAHIR